MRRSSVLRSLIVAFVMPALAACAGGGGGGGAQEAGQTPAPSGNAVSVRVTNDLVPPTPIPVWVIPETGSRRRLGTIEANGQGTFSFSPSVRGMEHRLMAQTAEGREVSSNPVTLEGVRGVRWSASSTVVSTERGAP